MTLHSNRGASGAHRWIACPGQPRLVESLPAEKLLAGGVYAAEGTAAHTVGEACLRRGVPAAEYIGRIVDAKDARVMADGASKTLVDGKRFFLVDPEMAHGVQLYLDEIARQRASDPGAQMFVEQRVQPFLDRDDMFGTADCVVHAWLHRLRVTDFKYGRKPVSPEHNPQAMFYALGAMNTIGPAADDVPEVEIVIVQPRVDEQPKRWVTTPEVVRDFGGILRSAADRTYDADAPLIPGDHCQFCPAFAVCPARVAKHNAELQQMFDSAPAIASTTTLQPTLDDLARVARVLALAPMVEEMVRSAHVIAQQLLEAGYEVKDPASGAEYKLVQGRSSRSWEDEEQVIADALQEPGIDPGDIFTPRELRSPAQIEAVLGKKWVEKRHRKIPGRYTVAPASDKREAVKIARVQFPELSTEALLPSGALTIDVDAILGDDL